MKTILKPTIILLLVIIISCGTLNTLYSLSTAYRKAGFLEMQRGFNLLEKDPTLHKIIELNIKVHIVGTRDMFKWDEAIQDQSIQAYATPDNEIYIFGAVSNGLIIINQCILGHEINHLLNFKDPEIADPDELDDLGA